MFRFDGQAKRKKGISLRGASGQSQSDRQDLIRQSRLQREKRQEERQRQAAAERIQSVYRDYMKRLAVKCLIRDKWENELQPQAVTPDTSMRLARVLFMFYRSPTDDDKLEIAVEKFLTQVQRAPLGFTYPPSAIVSCLGDLAKLCATFSKQSMYLELYKTIALESTTNGVFAEQDVAKAKLIKLVQNDFFSLLKSWYDDSSLRERVITILSALLAIEDDFLLESFVESICLSQNACRQYLLTNRKIPIQSVVTAINRPSSVLFKRITSDTSLELLKFLIDVQAPYSFKDIEASKSHYLLSISNLLRNISPSAFGVAAIEGMMDGEEIDSDDEFVDTSEERVLDQFSRVTAPDHLRKYLTISGAASDEFVYAVANFVGVVTRRCVSSRQRYAMLSTLSLQAGFVGTLWRFLAHKHENKEFEILYETESASKERIDELAALLKLFADVFHTQLFTMDDSEFFLESGSGFNKEEIVQMISILKEVAVSVIIGRRMKHLRSLVQSFKRILAQLHDRSRRLDFYTEDLWLTKQPLSSNVAGISERFVDESVVSDKDTTAAATLLKTIPFVVPFNTRAALFHLMVEMDRAKHRSMLDYAGERTFVEIHRESIYEDAFEQLANFNLKGRVQVKIFNEHGLEEAGIDGGGLFREFLVDLMKNAFDPLRGFFCHNTQQELYPNHASDAVTPNYKEHFNFLGRMLGKALHSSMLVDIPFASFFLAKLLGKRPFFNDLSSMDPDLHQNLLKLKRYKGDDIEDVFSLDFSIVVRKLGTDSVVPLVPGGADIPVNSENRMSYVYNIADFRLNRQIRHHCDAFREGLFELIPKECFAMFDETELQFLISGRPGPIDLADLKAHARVQCTQHQEHVVDMFWKVLETFDDSQMRKLVKFVTSCERPPLLGCKYFHPRFQIYFAGDDSRLPTASTCMNLLKMPAYETEEEMREKLLYSIEAGAGFELS